MNKNYLVIGLLSINVVLALQLWRQARIEVADAVTVRVEAPAAVVPSASPAAMPVVPVIEASMADGELAGALVGAGVPGDLVRQLLFSRITLSHTNPADAPTRGFWEAPASTVDRLRARRDSDNAVRAEMIAAFGAEIAEDPAFASLFRPLDDSLPFLASERQVEIENIRLAKQIERAERFDRGMLRGDREEMRGTREELELAIQSVLTPDEFVEYRMRDSLTAHQMRSIAGSFAYTEREFRDIYAILTGDGNPDRGIQGFYQPRETPSPASEAVRGYLGEARFAEYSRARDPAYRAIRTIGEREGHGDRLVNEIYNISSETGNEIRMLAADPTLSAEQRLAAVQQLQASARTAIEEVSDEQTAELVMNNALRGRRGGPPGGRRGGRPR